MEMEAKYPMSERANNEEVNNKVVSSEKIRGHWTPAEDENLRQLVAVSGAQNWNFIAGNLPGRTGKSCRLRWHNQLDPNIRKDAFTEIENEQLLAAREFHGNKWALIAKQFPGRTDNAVKNQWHVLMSRKRKDEEAGGGKRARVTDGGCNRLCSREMSIGSVSSSADSGVTANYNEPAIINTDLCLGSIYIQAHDDQACIAKRARANSPVSTGTGHCTSFTSKSGTLALELLPNYKEKAVNAPFIDFMGVGSI